MSYKSTFKSVLFSACAAALLTACGGGNDLDAAREATTMHRGNGAEPLTLDPHLASGTWENNIIGDMFMGLYTEDAQARPVYGLAQSHTVSEDGKTWTFTLRDALWSDGTPITAYDFEYSLQRILTPDTLSQYAFMLYPIVNAQSVNNGEADPTTLGVKAIDDKTFQINLIDPTPFLPGLLTHYTSYAVPAHIVKEHGKAWIRPENIVVSGPYMLEQWKANDFVHSSKNNRFYDAENVCISDIYYYPTNDANAAMRRVETGELHSNNSIPGKKVDFYRDRLPGYVHVYPYLASTYLAFNTKQAPFDNVDVRNALSMAIDREYIVDEVIQGGKAASYSLVPPGIDNYIGDDVRPTSSWAEKSLEERRVTAKALLEGAGFGPDKPLNFEYAHRNTADNPLAAPVLQESWNAIAPWVSATLQSHEAQIHYDNLRTGNFQIGDAGWVADYNDPQNYLFLLETRSGQMNYGRYSNPEFDKLLAQSASIQNIAERAQLLASAEKMMLDDMPIAPVWMNSSLNLVNPVVTGFEDNITDIHRTRFMCLDGPK